MKKSFLLSFIGIVMLSAIGQSHEDHAEGKCISESDLSDQFNEIVDHFKDRGLFEDNGLACVIDHGHDHEHRRSLGGDRRRDGGHTHDDPQNACDQNYDQYVDYGTFNSSCHGPYDICRAVIVELGLTTKDCLDGHDTSQDGQCISESDLSGQFNVIVAYFEDKQLFEDNGQACVIDHGHDHVHKRSLNDDRRRNTGDKKYDQYVDDGTFNSPCHGPYDICRAVIVELNLTTTDCLEDHDHDDRPSSAEAYGYGFLMILLESLFSLIVISLIPCIANSSKTGKRIYEYIYSFMIAMAISTLVSDAILHLIPHAVGGHGHGHSDDDHEHDECENSHMDFIHKGIIVVLGLYTFFMFEFLLHTFGHHNIEIKDGENANSHQLHSVANDKEKNGINPHDEDSPKIKQGYCVHPKKIKTVAWSIIIGDGIHNIADGIALGAAVSQSLSLGIATLIALVLHELPHELGGFVILVKSGFHWSVALLINFLLALTAFVGFFVGAGVSNHSEDANSWLLALAAGLFLYIGLTDLLPELVHGGVHGLMTDAPKSHGLSWDWVIRVVLINLGFFVGFIVLLIIAIYEGDLNDAI